MSGAPYHRLIETRCSWCHLHPCECIAPRIERCACGGDVRAREGDVLSVVMRAHQATEAHRAWRGRVQ